MCVIISWTQRENSHTAQEIIFEMKESEYLSASGHKYWNNTQGTNTKKKSSTNESQKQIFDIFSSNDVFFFYIKDRSSISLIHFTQLDKFTKLQYIDVDLK